MSEIRIGDTIDDHCSRCHRLTDHAVVAMADSAVRKTMCRTCQYEHEYRHGKGGAKKKGKLSAFEQVLASITTSLPAQPGRPAAGREESGQEPARARRGAPPRTRRGGPAHP